MAQRYFGRQVRVETRGALSAPMAFTLDGKEHTVEEVVAHWSDFSFGKLPLSQPRWWQRHHRNYFHVRTSEGEVFELYYDRGTSQKSPQWKRWYVTRRL